MSGKRSADARKSFSHGAAQTDAAGPDPKEDDIRNKQTATIVKSEDMNAKKTEHAVKENKKKTNEDKTIKVNKKEVKKNKTINMNKIGTPRTDPKSITKNKNKTGAVNVNIRKITEFLSISQDRGTSLTLLKPNPASKPAKQEKLQLDSSSLSDSRKVGGGKPVAEMSENEGPITQPSKGAVRRTGIGQM